MSTRIDINVAADLLRRLNRSQSQANRQSLSERERRDRLTQQGTALRQQQNAAAGLNFDGSIYRRRPTRPRFLEEPAATPLLTTPGFVLVPSSDYENGALQALTRKIGPVSFAPPTGANGPLVTNTGPNGVNAMQSADGAGLTFLQADLGIPVRKIALTSHVIEGLFKIRPATPELPVNGFYFRYESFSPQSGYFMREINWQQEWLYGSATQTRLEGVGLLLSEYIYAGEGTTPLDAVRRPEIDRTDTWTHIALQVIMASGQLQERLYFNGSLMLAKTETASAYSPPEDLLNASTSFQVTGRNAFVSGLRYSASTFYTGESFTPPTTITGLAR